MLRRSLIALALLGALGVALPGCIVVSDNKRHRGQSVQQSNGKHRHEHCHAKKHGKQVCHSHPHSHPHH